MPIGRERLTHAGFPHYQETYSVAQRIAFIGTRHDELKCSPMQSLIHPTDLDIGVV